MPEERSFELPPPGSHVAVCFRIVDLGTQTGQYGPRAQILFSWELPDELQADGRPFTISRRYGLSSGRKSSLRADVEGWLGRVLTGNDFGKFDLSTLLGTTCLIGIKHEVREDGRTFANVTSVMRRPKAVAERMPPSNEAVSLSLAERPFRRFEYEQLPEWVRNVIAQSPEYAAAIAPRPPVIAATKQRLKGILADHPAPKPEPVVQPLDDELPDFA
jgi:hypothetical protein